MMAIESAAGARSEVRPEAMGRFLAGGGPLDRS